MRESAVIRAPRPAWIRPAAGIQVHRAAGANGLRVEAAECIR
jgi:hypothetical protein